jgi:hypothetical protein
MNVMIQSKIDDMRARSRQAFFKVREGSILFGLDFIRRDYLRMNDGVLYIMI